MKHRHGPLLVVSVSGTYQTRLRARYMSDTVLAVSETNRCVSNLDTDLTQVRRDMDTGRRARNGRNPIT